MMEYVESKWTSEKLSKLSAAVLEKGKTIVEKAKKAENDKDTLASTVSFLEFPLELKLNSRSYTNVTI